MVVIGIVVKALPNTRSHVNAMSVFSLVDCV